MKNSLVLRMRSRVLSFFIIVALLSFGFSGAFANDESPAPQNTMLGAGTIEDPYRISNCSELDYIRYEPDASYILVSSFGCDAYLTQSFNDGQGFIPIDNFTGSLDGRKKEIYFLNIAGTFSNLGLFSTIHNTATVKNLNLYYPTVTNHQNDFSQSIPSTGVLAGTAENGSVVSHINVLYGNVTGYGNTGGIIGVNRGTLEHVNSNVTLNASSAENGSIGAIAGFNSGSLANTRSDSTLSAASTTTVCGGLIGTNERGTVTTSFAKGPLSCENLYEPSVGGLVGVSRFTESSITNSFSVVNDHYATINGGIVGNNVNNIDLSTNSFAADNAQTNVCDSSGNTQCLVQPYSSVFTSTSTVQPINTFESVHTWYINSSFPELNFNYNLTPLGVHTAYATALDDTISVSWNSPPVWDSYMPIEGYEVAYSTDGGITVNTVTTTDYTTTIENTDRTKEYTIRVRPYNSEGLGLPTYPLIVDAAPEKVTSTSTDEIQSGALKVSWDVPNADRYEYVLQYRSAGTQEWATFNTGSSSQSMIAPLAESTTYEYRVAAKNIRGMGEYSDITTATTIEQRDYTITSCEELQAIDDDLFGSYTLTQDIDCSNTAEMNDGKGFLPIGLSDNLSALQANNLSPGTFVGFGGTLNGQGHTISNLTIDAKEAIGGLFFKLDGANIHDLTLSGGHVYGSHANNGTVYTDAPVAALTAGSLAGISANATIDNVHSNINLKSTNTDGIVYISGGLIGIALSSSHGIGSSESLLTINNSSSTGDVAGTAVGGLVGAILPINFSTHLLDNPENIIPFIAKKVNVSLTNTTSTGNISCMVLCGGATAFVGGNLTIDGFTRDGQTGSLSNNMTFNTSDGLIRALDVFGPHSAGVVGVSLPLSFSDTPSALSLKNITVTGGVEGVSSAGLVGISLPNIHVPMPSLAEFMSLITSDNQSSEYIMSSILTFVTQISIGKSISTENVTLNANIGCVVICSGAVNVNLGPADLNGIAINGNIEKVALPASISQPDESENTNTTNTTGSTTPETLYDGQDNPILSMLSMFGPLTSGMVGINLPISTTHQGQEDQALHIQNSTVNANVNGIAASGLVNISLPSLAINTPEVINRVMDFITVISQSRSEDVSQEEYLTTVVSTGSALVAYSLSTLSQPAVEVDNVSINGDVTCSVMCSGGVTLSLSRLEFDSVTVNGNITNDNTELLASGNPISFCPAQITGGVVGTQLLFPANINNATVNGNVNVVQAGAIPDMSIVDVIDQIVGHSSSDSDGQMWLFQLGCTLGASLQGTGGVTGSYMSPLDITDAMEVALGQTGDSIDPWKLSIVNTKNTGDVTSSNRSATGGFIGYIFGSSHIANSSNTGTISNSTFAEMFRTPISSSTTGGLIGHSLGGLSLGGDTTTVIANAISQDSESNVLASLWTNVDKLRIHSTYNEIFGSKSTGNIFSSNTAGGLVGTASSSTRITKSYATGDVYGVTAGGLIGSGFNMGSPLGLLNLFGSIELNNTYSRGNIYAADNPDTFTFAGGLVGMMAHLGEFTINNSYSTGKIGVENNATNTRLIAGGLIGAELDFGFIPDIITVALEELSKLDLEGIGSMPEDLRNQTSMVVMLGNSALEKLETIGLYPRSGFSLTNSFTTSYVPESTPGENPLLREIATGVPTAHTTSGDIIGFGFSIDREEIRRWITSTLTLALDANQHMQDGGELTQEMYEALIASALSLQWRSGDQLAENTYFDQSQSQATSCSSSLPTAVAIMDHYFQVSSEYEDGGSPDVLEYVPDIQPQSGDCLAVNESGNEQKYFVNTQSIQPLQTWDFTSTWYSHEQDYPTFEPDNVQPPDPVGDPGPDGNGSPATDASGPNHNAGPKDFVPDPISPQEAQDVLQTFGELIPEIPPTDVLPNTIEKDITGVAASDPVENSKGIVPTVMGILAKTGIFLLRHIVEAILILIAGAGITYIARKRKKQKMTA